MLSLQQAARGNGGVANRALDVFEHARSQRIVSARTIIAVVAWARPECSALQKKTVHNVLPVIAGDHGRYYFWSVGRYGR